MKIDITREQAEAMMRLRDKCPDADTYQHLAQFSDQFTKENQWKVNPDLPWDDVDPKKYKWKRDHGANVVRGTGTKRGYYIADDEISFSCSIHEFPNYCAHVIKEEFSEVDDVDPALIEAARETSKQYHENRINFAPEEP